MIYSRILLKQNVLLVKKIDLANKGDKKASQNLQNELTGYAKDGTTCQVNNLIKED